LTPPLKLLCLPLLPLNLSLTSAIFCQLGDGCCLNLKFFDYSFKLSGKVASFFFAPLPAPFSSRVWRIGLHTESSTWHIAFACPRVGLCDFLMHLGREFGYLNVLTVKI